MEAFGLFRFSFLDPVRIVSRVEQSETQHLSDPYVWMQEICLFLVRIVFL